MKNFGKGLGPKHNVENLYNDCFEDILRTGMLSLAQSDGDTHPLLKIVWIRDNLRVILLELAQRYPTLVQSIFESLHNQVFRLFRAMHDAPPSVIRPTGMELLVYRARVCDDVRFVLCALEDLIHTLPNLPDCANIPRTCLQLRSMFEGAYSGAVRDTYVQKFYDLYERAVALGGTRSAHSGVAEGRCME